LTGGDPTDVKTETTPPTPQIEPSHDADILDPPPPTGLIEVLYAGADSGAWTYEQGLVTALQVLAGEIGLEDLSPESPTSMEGTGVVLEAQSYLRSGSDPQVSAEIKRLLNILAPAPDRLLEYARPANASTSRSPGLSRLQYAETD
jgi:hypothetical protein